ncbi:hypothetical protein Aperf_G00000122112 [Anoplocephala perfoliata]
MASMSRTLEWHEHSAFYRLRARCSALVIPFAFIFGLFSDYVYFIFFLYPLLQMIFGHPITSNLSSFCFSMILLYTLYWISDIDAPYHGGHRRSWFRKLSIWKWMSQYFQAKIVISEEMRDWIKENDEGAGENAESFQLPLSFNYLLGCHPHGIVPVGALMAYGSESLNISKIFPGIKSYMATHNLFYKFPICRDWALSFGCVSVNKESLEYLLDKNTTGISGNLVAVAVGGAREMLESRPHQYVLVLSRRRGFFRMALKTGACLVPSISFGETNVYDPVANPKGSRIRLVQDWFLRTCSVPPPITNPPLFIPFHRRITIVVGRPIMCELNDSPTDAEIDELREEYKQQLVQIFNTYRPFYDPTAEDIQFI